MTGHIDNKVTTVMENLDKKVSENRKDTLITKSPKLKTEEGYMADIYPWTDI